DSGAVDRSFGPGDVEARRFEGGDFGRGGPDAGYGFPGRYSADIGIGSGGAADGFLFGDGFAGDPAVDQALLEGSGNGEDRAEGGDGADGGAVFLRSAAAAEGGGVDPVAG